MSRSIDRLTSLDRLMLGASKRWPQDIGALAILDGTCLLDPTANCGSTPYARRRLDRMTASP